MRYSYNNGFSMVEVLVSIGIISSTLLVSSVVYQMVSNSIKSSDLLSSALAVESKLLMAFYVEDNFSKYVNTMKNGSPPTGADLHWPGIKSPPDPNDIIYGKVGGQVWFDESGLPCKDTPGCGAFYTQVDVKCFMINDVVMANTVKRSSCFGAYVVRFKPEYSQYANFFGISENNLSFVDNDYVIPINIDSYLRVKKLVCGSGQMMIGYNKFLGSGDANLPPQPQCISAAPINECSKPSFPLGVTVSGSGVKFECDSLKTMGCTKQYTVVDSFQMTKGDITKVTCKFPTKQSGNLCATPKFDSSGGPPVRVCPKMFYQAVGSCSLDFTPVSGSCPLVTHRKRSCSPPDKDGNSSCTDVTVVDCYPSNPGPVPPTTVPIYSGKNNNTVACKIIIPVQPLCCGGGSSGASNIINGASFSGQCIKVNGPD